MRRTSFRKLDRTLSSGQMMVVGSRLTSQALLLAAHIHDEGYSEREDLPKLLVCHGREKKESWHIHRGRQRCDLSHQTLQTVANVSCLNAIKKLGMCIDAVKLTCLPGNMSAYPILTSCVAISLYQERLSSLLCYEQRILRVS